MRRDVETILRVGFVSLLPLFCFTSLQAQSTIDLEPPLQAKADAELAMSPDPDALPVFRFATAEFDDNGDIVIATKRANQKLVAPMVTDVDPELDPKGIRTVENMEQTYTVAIPFVEKMPDGTEVQRTRTETRTRKVPVVRYKRRNKEQQAEFERRLAEKKKQDAESASPDTVAPAVATQVQQTYTVNIPQSEVGEDGVRKTTMRTERRTRTAVVYRGKTETSGTIETNTYKADALKFYSVSGEQVDKKKLKNRLDIRQPVIVINSEKALSPYFESLLSPTALFVVLPKE